MDITPNNSEDDITKVSSMKKRASVSDLVKIHEIDSQDLSLSKKHWNDIKKYAPVKHMIMLDLKEKYGSEWVSKCEMFCLNEELDIDAIFIQIKDVYQELYNSEYLERTTIMLRKENDMKFAIYGFLTDFWKN